MSVRRPTIESTNATNDATLDQRTSRNPNTNNPQQLQLERTRSYVYNNNTT